ncbi:exonuclease subunit SbcD [Zobellella aerophila]|uniref:Nuclease SbcCD subunit D n=1 Tax=Zobellella aerophila TaxID=870480 RepID=A0ABP6WEJ4_9GAMM
MRILHTSDWHLGQHFMGKTRAAEHQAFFGWLIEQIGQHRVDVVLVAGDVFDTGSPASYARELYNTFIVEIQKTGVELVILGGNHDSVAMLGEARELLGCLNTHVIPGVLANPADQLLVLPRQGGEAGAILCAIPYIRPRDVLESRAGQSGTDKQQALMAAIQAHYQSLFEQAQAMRDELALPLPIIATGHLTTVGASSSDSVRDIYIGSLEAFPAGAFPPADYIALGHLHKGQKVAGLEHVRYCGSPLALSFDEVGQQKQVLLLEFAEDRLATVTPLAVPQFQPLARVRGTLAELEPLIARAAEQAPPGQNVWLEVTVSGDDYLSDLQSRIQQFTRELPVEVLGIRRARSEKGNSLTAQSRETLAELGPLEVFERRLAQEQLDEPLQQQLSELYRQMLVQVQEQPA